MARLYRLSLWLFPPAFRLAYADCMTADFEDGLADARRLGRRDRLAGWLGLVALDLLWVLSSQWLRTSVPWLTAAYAALICTICEGLSAVMLARDFLFPVTLLPPVSAVIFLLWFVPPQTRRDRPISLRA